MKEGRDFAIIYHINSHYSDLKEDLDQIDSFSCFTKSKGIRRAILFDFMQIGELFNHLSKTFLHKFNNDNSIKLISIRNRIVHGYYSIRDDIIYDTLKNHLPLLIKELNEFARNYYTSCLKKLIGRSVEVLVDRPIGIVHEKIIYKHNYGYIKEMTALDGQFQDAYILSGSKPLYSKEGVVTAIIHRLDDIEDKLIVVDKDAYLSDEEIEAMVSFQEQFFKHEIIR